MPHSLISKKSFAPVALLLFAIIVGVFYYQNSNARKVTEEEVVIKEPKSFIPPDVGQVADINIANGNLLYLTTSPNSEPGMGGGHVAGHDLVVKDAISNEKKVIAKDVLEASFSNKGDFVVLSDSEYEIRIINLKGEVIDKIGKHGVNPVFSSDDSTVVYHRLANEGQGQDLFEKSPYGLVQYDIKEKNEKNLTDSKDDYEPLAFSTDMSKLYFNSGRAYDSKIEGYENHVVSLWVLDLKTNKVTRLTNLDEEKELANGGDPRVSGSALWSTDKKTIISEDDGEIWKFTLSDDGTLLDVSKMLDGTNVSWAIADKSINVLLADKQQPMWKVVSIN